MIQLALLEPEQPSSLTLSSEVWMLITVLLTSLLPRYAEECSISSVVNNDMMHHAYQNIFKFNILTIL